MRRWLRHVAGFGQPGEHADDNAFPHLRRPGRIHHRNVHGHDISRLIAKQFTPDRHAIRRQFTKMHLKADPRRGRRLSNLRLEHGVGQGFCEQAALRSTEPLFRCAYRNDRHATVPRACSRTDHDIDTPDCRSVTPGLTQGASLLSKESLRRWMDGRVKPGHDAGQSAPHPAKKNPALRRTFLTLTQLLSLNSGPT